MQSKNKPSMTDRERRHVTRIKLMPCAVCGQGGGDLDPSEAHEIKQGRWWLAIPLCASCHRSDHNGLHGRRHMWKVMGMDELDALGETIERLMRDR